MSSDKHQPECVHIQRSAGELMVSLTLKYSPPHTHTYTSPTLENIIVVGEEALLDCEVIGIHCY